VVLHLAGLAVGSSGLEVHAVAAHRFVQLWAQWHGVIWECKDVIYCRALIISLAACVLMAGFGIL
jgi:hypothetical protein